MGQTNHFGFAVIAGCLYLVLGLSAHAAAQKDSAYTLPQVVVADAPGIRTGYSVWTSDTVPFTGVLTLAERLLWENPMPVRTYAPAALTTLSARGAGPGRTAVFWQGVNLQSPMNGVVDAALLPVWPGDKVEVQLGGQSAAYSTGAMGGAVHLQPVVDLPDSAVWAGNAGLTSGAFGNFGVQGALGFHQKAGQALVRVAASGAENDFSYTNTTVIGAPRVRQQNNRTRRFDLQGFGQLEAGNGHHLETSVWYQKAFRQIPPAMTEAPSDTWQRDHSFRGVATWTSGTKTATRWQHRLAWLDEFIGFQLAGDVDSSRSRTALFSSEYRTALSNRFTLRAHVQGWFQQARSDGYADTSEWFAQKRLAALLTGTYHLRKLRLSMHLRQEWAEDQGAPFTWSAGGSWAFAPGYYTRWHVARNFNLPTFNDRFWQSLGNPNLKPESGYSAELGMGWGGERFGAELVGFYMQVDDWILWQPGPDGLFRPGNLRAVGSRGLESTVHASFPALECRWHFRGRYQWVRATNTAVYGALQGALHKVLPYTPEHSGNISLSVGKNGWSVVYFHQWTGKRFTTADNSDALSGFHTGNVLLQYDLSLFRQRLSLSARMENCWNTGYQIIAFRPMPGRSVYAGVQWYF